MQLKPFVCRCGELPATSVAGRLAQSGWLAAALLATIGGCGSPPVDARFQPGADDTVFGTVVDDRGSFEFIRDPQTGSLIRVNATGGQITLPTDGQDFGVERDTGGQLVISPDGAEEVIIAVREDPGSMDLDIQVPRETLGDLAAVVRQPTVVDEVCAANESFLDMACVPVNRVNAAQLAADIVAALESRGNNTLTEADVLALLVRYLTLPLNCCLAWDEFRDGGGVACPDI